MKKKLFSRLVHRSEILNQQREIRTKREIVLFKTLCNVSAHQGAHVEVLDVAIIVPKGGKKEKICKHRR